MVVVWGLLTSQHQELKKLEGWEKNSRSKELLLISTRSWADEETLGRVVRAWVEYRDLTGTRES